MPVLSSLIIQTVTLIILICWCGFSLWALLFGMTITGGLGLLVLPLLLQPWLNTPINPRWNWMGLCIPIIMWQSGWHEYRRERIILSCVTHQIYHRLHIDIPKWCPTEYRSPIDDWEPRTLYKPSQRVGIWIHHMMETIWLELNGMEKQAQQMRRMHFSAPVHNSKQPLVPKYMRGLCSPVGPTEGTVVHINSALLVQSAQWTDWYAQQKEVLSTLNHWETFQKGFSHQTHDRYALEVDRLLRPYAQVFLKQNRYQKKWTIKQPIVYSPSTALLWTPPFLFYSQKIPLDNALYCGLQMDGWLFPYREEWTWTEQQTE